MFDDVAKTGLARLIRGRIEDDHNILSIESDALAQYLSELTSIDIDAANSLLWGDDAELTIEQIERLASVLTLHREVLNCILVPTSFEIVQTVLNDVTHNSLAIDCPACYELGERSASARTLEDDDLAILLLDVLAHMSFNDEEIKDDVTHREWDEEDFRADQLLQVFFSLDEAARNRILAFAYMEGSDIANDPIANRLLALSTLRADYLTDLARQALDELARLGPGAFSTSELARSMGLANARSLGQLPRSVEQSLAKMAHAGLSLERPPLKVSRRGRLTYFTLSESALSAWQAMIRVDSASVPSSLR